MYIYIYYIYTERHSLIKGETNERNISWKIPKSVELNFKKRLGLSKEAVADDETWKNIYKQFDHRHLDNDLSIWKNFLYLRR